MKQTPTLRLLVQVYADAVCTLSEWRTLKSATVRTFLVEDIGLLLKPAAGLLLFLAVTVAGVGLGMLMGLLMPLNSAVAARFCDILLTRGGPLMSVILLIATTLPVRVTMLMAARRRHDFDGASLSGYTAVQLSDFPWIVAYATAAALGAFVWMVAGFLIAPFINALFMNMQWLTQTEFLLSALHPLAPWSVLLHGAYLGAVAGAAGLTSAREGLAIGNFSENEERFAALTARSLLLAVLAIALAEGIWVFLAWLWQGLL